MKLTQQKTFTITFLMLICISIITGLRSIDQDVEEHKQISLQLSTLVTSIASFHYYLMINSVSQVVAYRYFDWFFTTPILLIDLVLILFNKIPNIYFILEIASYNVLMLIFGYLGELNILSKFNSCWLGFIPFIAIFWRIYEEKKKRDNNVNNENYMLTGFTKEEFILFATFIFLWTIYGIVHLIPNDDLRQPTYNVLDLITKGFFGLYLYYKSI